MAVGFTHVGPAEDRRYDGNVFSFYVHPDSWGTGAARALMVKGLELVRTDHPLRVHLWTHAGAARAKRFYERQGWAATGQAIDLDMGDVVPSPLVEYEFTVAPYPPAPGGP